MARENETYRLELEEIRNRFGGKAILSAGEVSEYTGRCRSWCREKLGVGKEGITAVMLAKTLSSRPGVRFK